MVFSPQKNNVLATLLIVAQNAILRVQLPRLAATATQFPQCPLYRM
jgi:hypothetical protein